MYKKSYQVKDPLGNQDHPGESPNVLLVPCRLELNHVKMNIICSSAIQLTDAEYVWIDIKNEPESLKSAQITNC